MMESASPRDPLFTEIVIFWLMASSHCRSLGKREVRTGWRNTDTPSIETSRTSSLIPFGRVNDAAAGDAKGWHDYSSLAMRDRVFPVELDKKRLARLVTQVYPVGANPLGDIPW